MYFLFISANSLDDTNLVLYYISMRGSILTDIKRVPIRKGGTPLVFSLSSPFLRMNSSKHCLAGSQRKLVILMLLFTGRRISQVLDLNHCDILDDDHLYFKGHKRGNAQVIPVLSFLIKSLRLTNNFQEKIFNVNYKSVYSLMLRYFDHGRFPLCKKNRSVTHFPRKELLKKQLYDYRNTIDQLCQYFGWESKTSAFYYL